MKLRALTLWALVAFSAPPGADASPRANRLKRMSSAVHGDHAAVHPDPHSQVVQNDTNGPVVVVRDAAVAGGVSLRIMPVGDSITHGYQGGSVNADGNGYRLQLWNSLTDNPKDFVGSQSSGNMEDPANEGYNGATISEIATKIKGALPMRPNVVLIHAGTNDMNRPYEPSSAPTRLGDLIDQVVEACPDAAVLVAKIIPIQDATAQGRATTFNAALASVVSARAQAGKQVMLVDMTTTFTVADLIDGLHPTNDGYNKMGTTWYNAIKSAGEKGWIKAPVKGSESGSVCSKQPVWYPQSQIASGIGQSKKFDSVWYPKGEIASGVGKGKNVRFGDIDGDGRDDYLLVKDNGAVEAYLNTAGSTSEKVVWLPQGTIATGIGKDGEGVRFADLNGDGRDDYLWVSSTGAVICYLNKPGSSVGKPSWNPIGEVASGVGPRDRVVFGDVNGDGRDDYLLLTDNGGIQVWMNTGSGDSVTWMPRGEIASGIGSPSGVRIADMNNDGRDDYIWLSDDGRATLYTNTVGPDVNIPTWWPQGEIASGVGAKRANIVFADINGDGKSDYLVIDADSGAVQEWQNGGSGGIEEIGPGITFGDLNGDGKDDYLSVSHDGKVIAYINGGTGNNKQIWYPQGEIASGVGAKREQVRFGDMDGDGKVEYLYVHDNGAVESWRNLGSPDPNYPGKVTWYPQGTIATGIGKDGAGVTFADLNGDGRDDYLWVSDTGAVIAYLNGGGDPGKPVWFPQGTIATGVGAKRSEVRFADLNGDGRVEYLWVQSNGAVKAWYNAGSPDGNMGQNGGKVTWVPWDEVASGVGTAGSHIRFGDINGDKRADYMSVTNSNGAIDLWQNGCASSGDGSGDGGGGTSPPGTIFVPIDFCKNGGAGTATTWEKMSVNDYFSDWWNSHPDQTNLAVKFGSDWGLGQSFRCSLPNTCSAPLCREMDPQNDDTGKGWMVLESLQNLNQFLNKFREALHLTNTQYSTLQVAIEQDFDPGSTAKDISGSEALSAMSAIIGIMTGWMGPVGIAKNPAAAAGTFKEIFGGAARSITATLQASDISLKNIAEGAEFVHSFFGINLRQLEDMNINLMGRGSHKGDSSAKEVNLKDMFQDGYWVDYTQIPALNTDLAYPIATLDKISGWLFKVVLGNLVSSIWKKQGVWLASIPMTEAECKNNSPGNGDHRLKLCKDGKGYFLQRLTNKKSALGFDGWTATLPEFWGDMEEKYGITPQDAIESSVEAYKSGGFGFKAESLLGNILDVRGTQNMEAFASFPGIFTLPVCDLGQVFSNRNFDVNDYMEYIDKPGFNYNEDVGTGGNCYCVFSKDQNGKWFSDNYPFDPKC